MMRPIAVLCAVLLAGCRSVAPVSLGELRPGEPVRPMYRVPTQDSVRTPQLIRQVNGSIEVTTTAGLSPPFRIHLVDLEGLQVMRGRARPKGSFIGAAAGSFAGILIGMVCQARCPENDQGKRYLAPLVGFAIGVPVGAAVGTVLAPVRWVDVRLR